MLERDRAALLDLIQTDDMPLHELAVEGAAPLTGLTDAAARLPAQAADLLRHDKDHPASHGGHGGRPRDQEPNDEDASHDPAGFSTDLG